MSPATTAQLLQSMAGSCNRTQLSNSLHSTSHLPDVSDATHAVKRRLRSWMAWFLEKVNGVPKCVPNHFMCKHSVSVDVGANPKACLLSLPVLYVTLKRADIGSPARSSWTITVQHLEWTCKLNMCCSGCSKRWKAAGSLCRLRYFTSTRQPLCPTTQTQDLFH